MGRVRTMTRKEMIQEIVNEVCPEVTLIFNNEDDSYYEYATDTISIDPNPQDDDGFLRHLIEAHECAFALDYPLVLWTILHEIGHYFTLDEFDLEDDMETRILCATISFEVARDNPLIQNMYYDLHSEWVATEWAINFISQHRHACDELVALLD